MIFLLHKDLLLKNLFAGIKESDTGLGPPALWDLAADKQTLQSKILLSEFYN